MLLLTALTVAALSSSVHAQLPEQLIISVAVTDKKGEPLHDVKADEFEVKENGSSRPVLRAERDLRPLTLCVVLDSSAALATAYQADFVPPVLKLLQDVPEGTEFTVWTTSDRPKQIVEPTTDAAAAEAQIRQTAPYGANALVDTIVAASQPLNGIANRRVAMVIVTSSSMSGMQVDVQSVLPKASLRPTYLAVEVIHGSQEGRVQAALEHLASRTAGLHQRAFTTMSVGAQIEKLMAHLDAQYRVAWQPAVDPRGAKFEFKVKRKDTKVISAQRLSTAW